ncbi:DUF58 domain-containing protein [Luteolibacter luteus]|uniref:DUF58 domain-containing protein n=1 Tax=Luteolibacter luteus TaxID=2728835 RepID=A0A858RQC4_9BACT|nr:DUF58 domain-containing protein [Luteolibacter luteus]QJE98831.1 DUF58 domain-containing protein [Luteolibacter luteus]
MNEAILPAAKTPVPLKAPGVYADLGELIRLRYRANGISLLPRQPVTSVLSGRHASRLRGRGLNFEEIRRYLPGDDIRQMDWKVTARTKKPHIRVYTEERGRDVLLLVDQRLGMFFGSRRNFKSVTAAEIAALAAWRVIAAKDRVLAIVFGDTDFTVLPGGSSRNHVMRILQAVIDRNETLAIDRGIVPGPGILNEVLHRAERLVPHDALVLLISDGNGSDQETQASLSRIAAHNDVAVALVNDPLEIELPDAGSKVFAGGAMQLEADTSDAKLREEFRRDYRDRLEAARHYLIQRQVPILPIRTDEEVAPQVRKLLGARIRK